VRVFKEKQTIEEVRNSFKQSLRVTTPGAAGADKSKMSYLKRQFASELGFREAHTREFWVFVGLLVLTVWLRMWTHALGQYIFLMVAEVPVTQFKQQLFTVVRVIALFLCWKPVWLEA
jgi:hypothetical protein